jgi:predicted oxidoreductase
MKLEKFSKSTITSSRLIYGCMRICGNHSASDAAKGKQAIHSAIDTGFNHFDHADIYGAGACETIFGELLKESPHLRDTLFITSKAGIRPKVSDNSYAPTHYDFDQQYILDSVEGSLKRLATEQLDMFMLHRPDYLMDVYEVAETFQRLHSSGKVEHFGVSNFTTSQISLLQSALDMPIVANQIEVNIHNISAIEDGTLNYCQQHHLTPIAWCPLGGVAYPAWGSTFTPAQEQRINSEITQQAEKYNTQPWIIAFAWLLKHPAKIFPVVGSTTPQRIQMASDSLNLNYSKEDWYRLLEARNGQSVP